MLGPSIQQQPEQVQFFIADVQSLPDSTAFDEDMTEPSESMANPLDLPQSEQVPDNQTIQKLQESNNQITITPISLTKEDETSERNIDDESMPTLVSLTKTDNTVSKTDENEEADEDQDLPKDDRRSAERDSESENSEDDYEEDEKRNDQNEDEECVILSSGEDQPVGNDDDQDSMDSEDEDDDDDDEDEYEDDYDDAGRYEKSPKFPYRRRREKYSDEDEDDADLDDDRYNPDSFDGVSDDVLHRSSPEKRNNREQQKERSHSMQDLLEIDGGHNKHTPNALHHKVKPFAEKVQHYISGMNEMRKKSSKEERRAVTSHNEPTNETALPKFLENGEISFFPTAAKKTNEDEEMEIDVSEDSCPEQQKQMNGNVLKSDIKENHNGENAIDKDDFSSYEEYMKQDKKPSNIDQDVDVVAPEDSTNNSSSSTDYANLKMHLEQKSSEYDCLRDAYHRVMSENLSLKKDCQQSQRIYEENLSLKTELERTRSTFKNENAFLRQEVENLKVLLRKPDSQAIAVQTEESSSRPLYSKAFVTSSKILQTLANITQKPTEDNSDIRTLTHKIQAVPGTEIVNVSQTEDYVSSIQGASKKRKADENLESATSKHPKQNSEDKIKVFVYPEDEAGKQHSFLIQAEEISDNPLQGSRECGPYLLGNIEVYMTEVNGTISIWGKELQPQELNDNSTLPQPQDSSYLFRPSSTPRTQMFGADRARLLQKVLGDDYRFNSSSMSSTRKLNLEYNESRMRHSQSLHDHAAGPSRSCCARKEDADCCHRDSRRLSLPDKCCNRRSGGGQHSRHHSFEQYSDDDDYSDNDDHHHHRHRQHSGKKRFSSKCGLDNSTKEDRRLAATITEIQKQQQSGGKRVRNLLTDMLKNCGDYRSSTGPSKRTNPKQTNKQNPFYSNEVSSAQNSPKSVDCDNQSEVVSLLDHFTFEMEKLKTRSNHLRDLIQELS